MSEDEILELINKLTEYLDDEEGVESEAIENQLYNLRERLI